MFSSSQGSIIMADAATVAIAAAITLVVFLVKCNVRLYMGRGDLMEGDTFVYTGWLAHLQTLLMKCTLLSDCSFPSLLLLHDIVILLNRLTGWVGRRSPWRIFAFYAARLVS
jgi:hypothetical protein